METNFLKPLDGIERVRIVLNATRKPSASVLIMPTSDIMRVLKRWRGGYCFEASSGV
jgi:hypothetical protein